jgi:hypothetical protein
MKNFSPFNISLVFLGIFIFLFLFPFNIEAKELTQEEIDAYIQMPETDVKSILRSLPESLTNKWMDSVVSVSSPEEEAIVLITRQAIRGKMMDYFLREAPKELGKEAVKMAFLIGKLALTKDISALLTEFEKMTVKESLEYLGQWLEENQTKIAFGNIDFSYDTLTGKKEKNRFQYIVIYSPDTKEVVIKIYSANPIAPPASRGSLAALTGTGWNYSKEQAKGKKIPSFILSIKGKMSREQSGYWKKEITHSYSWDHQPRIEIEFSDFVPYFDFHKKGFFERMGDKVKGFFGKISGGLSGLFGASIVQPSFDDFPEPLSGSQPDNAEWLGEFIKKILEQIKLFRQFLSDLEYKQIEEEAKKIRTEEDFNALLKKLEDAQAQIDKMQGLIDEESQDESQQDQDQEQETEDVSENSSEEAEESKNNSPAIIINEICVGLDNSKNEFIELYNPNNTAVLLNNDNFQLELVSSSNKSTKKKIDWLNNYIPAHGYFLLTGGELVINGARLESDAGFSSQLSSVSGVIISDKEGNTLDKVGWGSTTKSPPALAIETKGKILDNGLKTGESIERRENIDTENNSEDFGLSQSPSPTNSKGEKRIYTQSSSGGGTGGGSSGSTNGSTGGTEETTSLSLKILISEVQIEGETKLQDFIELYNPLSDSVDISGWRLRKRNQTGIDSSIRVFPEGSNIAGKSYFLWASSKEEDYPSSIGADVFSTAYLTENKSIALLDDSQEIIDAVAWGTGHNNPFVETHAFGDNPKTRDIVTERLDEIGFTGERTSYPYFIFYQSLGRKVSALNGEQDTDNNLEDFELQNPTPKAENETFIEPILQDIWEEIDSTPPETEIISNPPILTNQTQAIFGFQANEDGSSFECRLDIQNWESCESPKTYTDCSEGQHRFSVRAIDLFLNVDLTPAEYTWTIDTGIESPIISLFDLDTDSEFYTNQRTVGANISTPGSEQGLEWFLLENSEKPATDDCDWQSAKPETFILSEPEGSKTVYIWTKDGAGNISPLGNSWSIILDTLSPSSHIADLEEFQISADFNVVWSGSDETGISYYDIQFKDGLTNSWQDWQVEAEEINAEFTGGENGHTYYFRSRAVDLASNLEDWPSLEQGDSFTLVDLSVEEDKSVQDVEAGQDNNAILTFADGLIISEVMANGTEEFIEIYNSLAQEISLDGLYLSYFSETRDWNEPYINKEFPTSTIASQEYYLIGFGDYTEEPDTDWSPDTRHLSDNSGSVGLFSCNPKIATTSTTTLAQAINQARACKIDALGWGESIVKEGQTAPPAQEGKSLARKIEPDNNGYLKYVDTDDNSVDFEDQEPTPRIKNYSNYFDLDDDGIIDSYDPITIVSFDTEIEPGEYLFKDLFITNKANLLLKGNSELDRFKGVKIIADNLIIETNCSLNSDKQGYPGSTKLEKNYFSPQTLGSGGPEIPKIPDQCCARPGGYGGGAIILKINNTLEIQGRISVNAENGSSSPSWGCASTAGGEGGSVYITTNILKGNGEIIADGGNGDKNFLLGNGGQIAVYYQDKQDFAGVARSFGGEINEFYASPGTVYFENPSEKKLIIQAQSKEVIFELSENLTGLEVIEINNITVNTEISTIFESQNFIMDSALLNGPDQLFLNFQVSNFSLTNSEIRANVNISAQNLDLDITSLISSNGKGYPSDMGPGTGEQRMGGSYGGVGMRNDTTSIYGSSTEPIDFGSGGGGNPEVQESCCFRPGGAGGGVVILDIKNKLKVNGIISANGGGGLPSPEENCRPTPSYGCGATTGGSGGSVYITVGTLEGVGSVRTNGGGCCYRVGAGGGGRVAVYGGRNNFSGIIESLGGENPSYEGVYAGEDGTVYLSP